MSYQIYDHTQARKQSRAERDERQSHGAPHFEIEPSGQVYAVTGGDRRLLGGIAYLRRENTIERAALLWWKTWTPVKKS